MNTSNLHFDNLEGMTLYQFNLLDEMEQHEALWENGVMVGDKVEDVHRVVLYQIDSFYEQSYPKK